MSNEPDSVRRYEVEEVVALLAEVWPIHRDERFYQYLQENFGKSISEPARFDCLYIAQTLDGDVDNAVLHFHRLRWWRVDDSGTKELFGEMPLPRFPDAPENNRGELHRQPSAKFLLNGSRILIGESYGPTYFLRKVARLKRIGGQLQFREMRVVKTYDTLGGPKAP